MARNEGPIGDHGQAMWEAVPHRSYGALPVHPTPTALHFEAPMRKLLGAAAGVPQAASDTSIGDAAGGAAQAAAASGGYAGGEAGGAAYSGGTGGTAGGGGSQPGVSSAEINNAPYGGGGAGSGGNVITTQASNTSGSAGTGQGYAPNVGARSFGGGQVLGTALPTAQTGNALPV